MIRTETSRAPHGRGDLLSRPAWILLLICLACTLIAACLGCGRLGDHASPQASALRSKYLATREPAGGMPLPTIRKSLDPAQTVVVVGRIGVPDQEPWIAGKAAFSIRDAADEPPGDHGGRGHDPANCPFCKRKAMQPDTTALVQFVDEGGDIIGIDARELFGLTENQRVVIEGRAGIVEADTLVVTAEKLYLAPE